MMNVLETDGGWLFLSDTLVWPTYDNGYLNVTLLNVTLIAIITMTEWFMIDLVELYGYTECRRMKIRQEKNPRLCVV